MARRQSADFEALHERSEATSLAAVLLADGTFDRVDTWTPLDEVIAEEPMEVDPEKEHLVMVPIDEYDLMMGAVECCEQRGWTGKLEVDEKTHVRVPVGSAVLSPDDLAARVRRAKLNTLLAMLRYVWFNANHLWAAMRNLLAITHKMAPTFVKGMSGADIAKLLGVGRAAFNKTEILLVVEYLERWGVAGGTAGGSKPAAHRELKRQQMLGRKHRAADYVSDKETEVVMTEEQRRRANDMRREAERKRLAELAGVQPHEINLDMTHPNPRALKRRAEEQPKPDTNDDHE